MYTQRYALGDQRLGRTTQLIAIGSPRWSGELFRELYSRADMERFDETWAAQLATIESPEHVILQSEAHIAVHFDLREEDLPAILILPSVTGWWDRTFKPEETIVRAAENGLLRFGRPYDALTALIDALDTERILGVLRRQRNSAPAKWRDVVLDVLAPLTEMGSDPSGTEHTATAETKLACRVQSEASTARWTLEVKYGLIKPRVIGLLATILPRAGSWTRKELGRAARLHRSQLSEYLSELRNARPMPLIKRGRGYPLTVEGADAARLAALVAQEDRRLRN